jgi:hypothetical protein
MACKDIHDCLEGTCPECGLFVDAYGNTEDDFRNCCFPDCGCDGARVCMAPSGCSRAAACLNLERGAKRVSYAELHRMERESQVKSVYIHTGPTRCACLKPAPRNTRDKQGNPFKRCTSCWRIV